MADMEELYTALRNADAAGDVEAARKIAAYIQQQQIAQPAQPQSTEPTLGERLLGAGEAALTTATGAVGGTLGLIGGTVGGIAGSIMSGQFGTREAQRAVEEEAMRGAERLTYQPRTIAGHQMAGAVGEVAKEAAPLAALAPQMAILGELAPSATVAARGAASRIQTSRPNAPALDTAALVSAKTHGIDVMTSDIKPPRTFVGRAAQKMGESVPFAGTGGKRAAQQLQRVEAVKNTLKDFGAFDHANASEAVMKDLSAKRSGDIQKYSGIKKEVISRMDEAGEVPVIKAVAKVDEEIAKLSAISPESYAPVIARLEQFKSDIAGKTLSNIEENRKLLGESFKSQDLVSVRDAGEKSVANIYGALREDMGDFIKANGDRRDYLKWKVANNRLSEMSGELKNTALKSTLRRGDTTPEVVNNMLFSAKPSEVKSLYSNLTPEGRANARAAILDEAIKKAGGIDNFSPDVFNNHLKKRMGSVNVFFTGNDRAQIEGLSRALDITRRAGDFAAHPPTGAQLYIPVGAAALTDLFGGMGAGLVSGATIGFMARAYESPAIRNILIKLSKTANGSFEEAALISKLNELAAAMAAMNAGGNK